MSLSWGDIASGIEDAKQTLANADRFADGMARALRGRLRHVGTYTLRAIKAELRDFNSKTGEWK